MNTSQLKSFAIRSRQILKEGVLNRIISLGFDSDGALTVDRPVKIGGGTVFMGQLRDEAFFDAWSSLESKIAAHGIKDVCEEAAYTWFNRLVAIRIMQKNDFIEPVMAYTNEGTRMPVIVNEARSGHLSLHLGAAEKAKLDELLRDPAKINEQFNLLISAFCESNPVIFNCFGGIEKHIGLLLPDNILAQDGFIDLLNHTSYLTEEDYRQSELIGWLYQFYISEKKDEVFAKKGKYDPDEIPAATQIFTPNWIVKYMVQNTLGRIYLDNNPASSLREKMKYLVEPAEPTPEDAVLKIIDMEGYTLIDPACGSGHILVEAFDLLFEMYKDEAYSAKASITNILSKNLIGIDLDTRAKQLATFALLMKACQKDRSFLDSQVMPRIMDMPEPFVYHDGTMKDFLGHFFIGGNNKIIEETEKALELMRDANTLGSIMKFNISEETRLAIQRSTEQWEKQDYANPSIKAVLPSMKVILALTDKYATTVMNPPYMGSGKFDATLSNYVAKNYQAGKADLFAVFMLLGLNLLSEKGKMGMINMQSWMFLDSFEALRADLCSSILIDNLLHLGPRTFDELSGEIVQNVAFVFSKISNACPTICQQGIYYRLVEGETCNNKENLFLNPHLRNEILFSGIDQHSFEKIPGCVFAYWLSPNTLKVFDNDALDSVSEPRSGVMTGNDALFTRMFYECSKKTIATGIHSYEEAVESDFRWFFVTRGGGFRRWYGNYDLVNDIYKGGRNIINSNGNYRLRDPKYYFKEAVTWNMISSNKPSFRFVPEGILFGNSAPALFPKKNESIHYILALLNSRVAYSLLNIINPTINVTKSDVGAVPYVLKNATSIESLSDSNVEISKEDWDAHETSWDFKENELVRIAKSDLIPQLSSNGEKMAVSIDLHFVLDQYKIFWSEKFHQLHSNEEELNRQFIEIYGLQDELTSDVPLNEITILQQDEISIENNQIVWHDDVIIKQLLSYAIGCWMGRYRLDKEGLNIAHYPTPEEVCSYNYKGHRFVIDDDAIIPLMGKDTPFEDDNALQKIVNFVKFVFGEDNLTENLNFIEHCLGKSIEDYLIKDFWKNHKKMYQNRPIYWLFSSKKGAFQALVYMHRMNPYTAEKVRTKYLLPYIEHLKGKIEIDQARGSELTSVERKNLVKMQTALAECLEYHDSLHEVAIKNIDFDLDDGVVVNYAKFGDVLAIIK